MSSPRLDSFRFHVIRLILRTRGESSLLFGEEKWNCSEDGRWWQRFCLKTVSKGECMHDRLYRVGGHDKGGHETNLFRIYANVCFFLSRKCSSHGVQYLGLIPA